MFPKIFKTTRVSDQLPILGMTDDGITFTKERVAAKVIRLQGRDYSGLAAGAVSSLYQGRKLFFDTLPVELTCMVQSHRRRVDLTKTDSLLPSNYYARKIAEASAKSFDVCYRTNHQIIFTTRTENKLSQIGHLVTEKSTGVNSEQLRIMEDTVNSTLQRFKDYDAEVLKGEDLSSYWATLLNGRAVRQLAPEDGLFGCDLAGAQLFFPAKEKYMRYRGVKDIFSGFLIIQAPPNKTSGALLDELFQAPVEFSVFQSYARFEKGAALRHTKDKQKNAISFIENPEIKLLELNELSNRLESDEMSLIRHRWTVEVFGNSPKDLEKNIVMLADTIERHGYRVVQETVGGREALFWCRFPEYELYNARTRTITSRNASHSATFPAVGEGKSHCSWGNEPHCYVKTKGGAQYGFTYHEHGRENALGNMLIVGGSESGKTLFTSYVFSQCLKYPNFSGVLFDRHFGLEVFTEFMDGKYISARDLEKLEVNPVQLPDTPEHRMFLVNLLQMLTGMDSTQSITLFANAVDQVYQLDFKDRNLVELANALGLPTPGSEREAMGKWLPGGPYGAFLNHPCNALNFDNPITTFDMTAFLDNLTVLGPYVSIIFHFILIHARKIGGLGIFMDEIPKYLDSPIFGPQVGMLLREIRKLNGVVIAACQSADTILNSTYAATFVNNCASILLYPEPTASREHYMEGFKLNESELNTVRTMPKFFALQKWHDGSSVTLDLRLFYLGNLIRMFDSGGNAVHDMHKFKRSYPNGWKSPFLNR